MTDSNNYLSGPVSDYGETPQEQASPSGFLGLLGQVFQLPQVQKIVGQLGAGVTTGAGSNPPGASPGPGTTIGERQNTQWEHPEQVAPGGGPLGAGSGAGPASPSQPSGATPGTPAPVAPMPAAQQIKPNPVGTAAQAAPMVQVPPELRPLFDQTEQKYSSLPQGYLEQTARLESGFKPGLTSPTGAKGPMQFIDSTAKQYGITDPMDWGQSLDGAARLGMDNLKYLQKNVGAQISASQLYLAHQQGAGGAAALLNNPDMNATEALEKTGLSPKAAALHITANGGKTTWTAGQFANYWDARFNETDPHSYDTEGNKTPTHSDTAHPALVAAHKMGDPLMHMALLKTLAPDHSFTPVSYDPFKVQPPAEPWIPVGR